ncbi:hypothetical protein D5018_04300 [Parashewanella curva]|uniref:Uncharacterized protein n=1 Tax=Parashewanella curva TaxID=2338552 RepID=A0A3L8Q0B8_9GAMM|nr:hypothetical protein [Parashewanella curva]RLV60870.1 hypothetical protein D5018_04300 [Parashewanella curva]
MVWFVFLVLYLLFYIPTLPWKVHGYVTKKEVTTLGVKIEEFLSVIFHLFGCIALYELASGNQFISPMLWALWFSIGILWTISPLIISSPKLEYLKQQIPNPNKQKLVYLIGSLFMAPLYVGVFIRSSFVI